MTLLIVAPFAHAETHSGGIGPDGRPIAPGNSQAKLFQLVNACLSGRGVNVGGLGAPITGGNQPPSVGAPDFSGGLIAPPFPGAGPGAGPSTAGLPAGDATRGNGAFQAKCLSCHGPGRPQAALLASGPMGAGRVLNAGNPMPPANNLTPQEKADVVAFLNAANDVR